jgi:hypothetical protein
MTMSNRSSNHWSVAAAKAELSRLVEDAQSSPGSRRKRRFTSASSRNGRDFEGCGVAVVDPFG